MTDVATVTARIVAILDDITGVTASDVYPDDITNPLPVPFCFIEEGAATFTDIDSDTIEVTQEWAILLYGAQFETSITGQEDTAYQACRPYLTSIPQYFWNRKRLQRNDQGLADIKRARITGHEGIQSASRNNKEYMGIGFTLSVVYDMYTSQI